MCRFFVGDSRVSLNFQIRHMALNNFIIMKDELHKLTCSSIPNSVFPYDSTAQSSLERVYHENKNIILFDVPYW